MSISEKIDKHPENRKKQAQKITGLKEKIEEGRKKVYQLDLQGFSNQEIADQLGVGLSTIEKDLHYMRYYCLKWSKQILDTDYAIPLVDSVNQINMAQRALWALYRDEDDVMIRKKILDSIITSSEKKVSISNFEKVMSLQSSIEMSSLEEQVMKDLDEF